MGQTCKIYGASDDLVEVEGVEGADEFGCWGGGTGIKSTYKLGGVMKIYAIYDGCWHFSVGQVDENTPLPAWPIRITSEHYSAVLEIDVPEGVAIVRTDADEDDES